MQGNEACAICDRQPEDLLVLLCGHNLCVTCATEIYTLNQGANPLVCEICLMETHLDQETIAYFQSATQPPQPPEQKKEKPAKPPKSKSPQKKGGEPKSSCKMHNEIALYYCYNCNAADICSECILTPKHSSHKVLTLKKAMQGMQRKIQEDISTCEFICSQLNEQREIIGLKKSECLKSFLSKKEQVKEVFDEIARAVSDRYSALCLEMQQECAKVMNIYEAYLSQVSQKCKLLEQSIKLQRKSQQTPSQAALVAFMADQPDIKTLFFPANPKELPPCALQLCNAESLCYQINSLLSKFAWSKDEEEEPMSYSVIGPQSGQEEVRTALKESQKGSMNINRTQNRVGSSRKLDLSRSIENATYIINRLQQRSKIG